MAAKKDRVLWADDEIDLLKPHILFLQDKGYEVVPVVSGQDAIDCCKELFRLAGKSGAEATIQHLRGDTVHLVQTIADRVSFIQSTGNRR